MIEEIEKRELDQWLSGRTPERAKTHGESRACGMDTKSCGIDQSFARDPPAQS
jgi:hypothetical protein